MGGSVTPPSRRALAVLAAFVVAAAGCSSGTSATPAGSSRSGSVSLAPVATSGSAASSATPSSPALAGTAPAAAGGVLFDDFSYATAAGMAANGWIIRDKAGWPGVPGSIFDSSTVSMVQDPAQPSNRLMQISSWSDGKTTHQTQVCQARKFLAGTYGARVFFNDAPSAGPDGDQVVETFYLISPYVKPNDPSYSEADNEYLPNGGWGGPDRTFYVTTWATVTLEPWSADNASNNVRQSLQGWHDLVLQVADRQTRFYLDGQLIATHGEHYYPRVPMSINFNLWFIAGGLLAGSQKRVYDEQVDWVFHQAGAVLTPDQVTAAVADLRASKTAFKDTVPSSGLASPCDM